MKAKIAQALLGMLLMVPLAAEADATDETPRQALVLKFADETTASFFLADQPDVGFADGKLTVASAGVTTDYNQSDVSEFYFDYVVPTSVDNVAAGNFALTYTDNNTVSVSGASAAHAALYSADGKQVAAKPVTDGTVSFSLDACKAGVYILTLENEHSFKILKK